MNRCTYVLAGNYKSRLINTQTPVPANLHEQQKQLFIEQEKERQKLFLQVCLMSLISLVWHSKLNFKFSSIL